MHLMVFEIFGTSSAISLTITVGQTQSMKLRCRFLLDGGIGSGNASVRDVSLKLERLSLGNDEAHGDVKMTF